MPFDPLNESCRFGCLKHGYGYLRWGAVRKVRQLDEMYPDLSRKNHFLARRAPLVRRFNTSTSTACSRSARTPLRKTSVSGSAKSSWLGELENVSVGLGVSLL
jgi:hypothetical protein